MKKIFLLLSLTLLMISCKPNCAEPQVQTAPEPQVENIRLNSLGNFPYNDKTDEITIQEIDGCEYLVVNGKANQEPAITHKGNCKYCTMRAQAQIIQPIKDSIK